MMKSLELIRKRILYYEEMYPAFATAQDANEIAMIYGWGNVMTAYENYANLKDLLEISK
jgi:hypothetical protein